MIKNSLEVSTWDPLDGPSFVVVVLGVVDVVEVVAGVVVGAKVSQMLPGTSMTS